MTTEAVRANVNLPGLPAGAIANADTSEPGIKAYLDAGYAETVKKADAEGARDIDTGVLAGGAPTSEVSVPAAFVPGGGTSGGTTA